LFIIKKKNSKIFSVKGLIPKSWRKYTVPKNLTVDQWILDFAERIKQMSRISKAFSVDGPQSLKVY
jgi:dynein heavy chain 1, cytosolic